jgi:ABC-2 type transport system ATP-binding protein
LTTTTESFSRTETERTQDKRLFEDHDDASRALAVRVRNLVKRYRDGTEANRGIDLDVRRGETVAMLGPNGAGKTTFLRQLTTELRPTSGSIAIFNQDAVAHPQAVKAQMGITPQEAGVFESLSVLEHFELFARFKDVPKREAKRAAQEVIGELDLTNEAKKRVGTLSGGQRRRVLVGLALLGRPPLLVLDEPTTGLDPDSRRAVWNVIRRAVTKGTTVILSTHYMEEAERLSDRIAIIVRGRLVAFGTLDELLARLDRSYRLTYVAPDDPFGKSRTQMFSTNADARSFIVREKLTEYAVARASLEDVYFALTGARFAEESDEERMSLT